MSKQQKPNILVIWGGGDIGVHNISAYNHGVMGYRTPNIDISRNSWPPFRTIRSRKEAA